MELSVRFWSKVDDYGPVPAHVPELGSCWVWLAGLDDDGYGKLSVDGESLRAHRVSWLLFIGKIPDGLCVCHHCDNPICVRPSHLFLGTNAENRKDMVHKGRGPLGEKNGKYTKPERTPRGENNGQSKLTEVDVRLIRAELARGVGWRELAKRFNVTTGPIQGIARGKTWKHIL